MVIPAWDGCIYRYTVFRLCFLEFLDLNKSLDLFYSSLYPIYSFDLFEPLKHIVN